MEKFKNLITGGFLAGYRTYIIFALIALQQFAAFGMGDITLVEALQSVELRNAFGALGFMAMRKGIDK